MDMVKKGIQWVAGMSVMLSERNHTAVVGDKINSGVADGRNSETGSGGEEKETAWHKGKTTRKAQSKREKARHRTALPEVWLCMAMIEMVVISHTCWYRLKCVESCKELDDAMQMNIVLCVL